MARFRRAIKRLDTDGEEEEGWWFGVISSVRDTGVGYTRGSWDQVANLLNPAATIFSALPGCRESLFLSTMRKVSRPAMRGVLLRPRAFLR